MLRRSVALVALAPALALGVASATSLGAFGTPVSTGLSADVAPCTYDVATPFDALGNDLLTVVLPTSAITTIELTDVAGDCSGHVPIVAVQGDDFPVPSGARVLFVIDDLAPLGPADVGTVTLPLVTPVPLGDGLNVLFVLTDVRVGFCPGGATCS